MCIMNHPLNCVVFFLVLLGIFGFSNQDVVAGESVQSYAPDHGDYFNIQDWKAVTSLPELSSMGDMSEHWSSIGSNFGERNNGGEENGENKKPRRRKNRRRRRKQQQQQNKPFLPDLEEGGSVPEYKARRRPFSQAKQQDNEDQDEEVVDIKSLLKQSDGLSLSEVLQRRNLSLSDLLTGKQQAISALKMTDHIKVTSEDTETEIIDIDENGEHIRTRIPGHNKATKQHIVRKTMTTPDREYAIATIQISETDLSDHLEEDDEADKKEERPKRPTRLPPVKSSNQMIRKNDKELVRTEIMPQRRKLPQMLMPRRNNHRYHIQHYETTTEENAEIPSYFEEEANQRDRENDNAIRDEDDDVNEGEEKEEETVESTQPSDTTDDDEEEEQEEMEFDEPKEEVTTPTTTSTTTTTTTQPPKITTLNPRNRLNLKPRLRLPPTKNMSQRVPTGNQKITNPTEKETMDEEIINPSVSTPINIKEVTRLENGTSIMLNASNNEVKLEISSTEMPNSSSTTTTIRSTAPKRKSYQRPKIPFVEQSTESAAAKEKVKEPSAKEEILEVLNDYRGGERLARILADRNMSLGELVEQRERGSSQVHLADIFHNTSKEPNVGEPFLSKSMIEPISKEIYPLKALLEGNMRQSNNKTPEKDDSNQTTSLPGKDAKAEGGLNDDLGIMTLFDTLSEMGINPKDIKPSDIKKDSDGSSYFTSVISVKPTNEIYKESRNDIGFKSSNKQTSEIFSSIPTYIQSDEIVNAKVVPDWTMNQGEHIGGNEIERDLDGDGLIVLGDLQPLDDISLGASRSKYNNDEQNPGESNPTGGVRSAILVSGAIVGTSIVVFLTILVGCRIRQTKRRRRNMEDQVGSVETVGGRKLSLHTSRSASPILPHPFSSPGSPHHYHWDSLKKPFQ